MHSSSVSLIPFVLMFVYQDPLVPSLLFLSFLLGSFSGVSRAICFLFAFKEVTKFKLFKSIKRQQGNMFVSVLVVIIGFCFQGHIFQCLLCICKLLWALKWEHPSWSRRGLENLLYYTQNQCSVSQVFPSFTRKEKQFNTKI